MTFHVPMVVVVLGEMMVVGLAVFSLSDVTGLRVRGSVNSPGRSVSWYASWRFYSSAIFYLVGLLTPRPTLNLEGQGAVLLDRSPTDLPDMVRPTRSTRLPPIQL